MQHFTEIKQTSECVAPRKIDSTKGGNVHYARVLDITGQGHATQIKILEVCHVADAKISSQQSRFGKCEILKEHQVPNPKGCQGLFQRAVLAQVEVLQGCKIGNVDEFKLVVRQRNMREIWSARWFGHG